MRVSDFHFDLPADLIAQHPPAERGASRMLVVGREEGGLRDAMFRDLPQFLEPGDLLVLNDSRVLPARLFATRGGLTTQAGSPQSSGVIEVLLTEEQGAGAGGHGLAGPNGRVWKALVKPAKKVKVGETLEFRGPEGGVALTAEVVGAGEFGERTLRFAPVADFHAALARIGHMPLPPYIHRDQAAEPDSAEDRERYQTVFSQKTGSHEPGSAAAPTAGLHFTPEVLVALEGRGVEIAYVTLHVGLGTFQPVRVDRVEEIRLHSERYTLPAATADALNRAMAEGRRVIAVGTTTTRTLEHIAMRSGIPQELKPPRGQEEWNPKAEALGYLEAEAQPPENQGVGEVGFEPHSGETSIFLGPGYRFRMVRGLLTNFHLPESTLLMLVSAFAGRGGTADGREMVLAAYAHAIRERYRFYSYGDCMLVV